MRRGNEVKGRGKGNGVRGRGKGKVVGKGERGEWKAGRGKLEEGMGKE